MNRNYLQIFAAVVLVAVLAFAVLTLLTGGSTEEITCTVRDTSDQVVHTYDCGELTTNREAIYDYLTTETEYLMEVSGDTIVDVERTEPHRV